MNTNPLQQRFLTTKQVAELLHVNEKMVYILVNEKGLPATKVTGKWVFPRKLVEEWLESHITGFGSLKTASLARNDALLIAGSDDPLFQQALSLFHSYSNETIVFLANIGSMGGLSSMKKGVCHVAVCHLLQDENNEYNFDFAVEELDTVPVVVNFSMREQGLLIEKGNPKNIGGVADFSRDDVRVVNRPLGTGTRLLFDHELTQAGLTSKEVQGYATEVAKHLDAGLEIQQGKADAAPGIRAVAGLLDLDFIPLRWERFDLLITKERFFDKNIQELLGFFHNDAFVKLTKTFEGYDTSLCGKMIYPNNLN